MKDDVPVHPNCAVVNEVLQSAGVTGRVRLLDKAVTTARAAAEQLGCPVGAIANSLIFEASQAATATSLGPKHVEGPSTRWRPSAGSGRVSTVPLLAMTSGAHRVDMSKVGEHLGYQLRRASPAFVREHTRQPIGGVAPVGHPKQIRTVVDRALAAFDELWAAGGIPHAVFPLTYDELLRLTHGVEADVG